MSEQPESLADKYYAVAAELESRARRGLDIAEYLSSYADWLCEQEMRRKSRGKEEVQGMAGQP